MQVLPGTFQDISMLSKVTNIVEGCLEMCHIGTKHHEEDILARSVTV